MNKVISRNRTPTRTLAAMALILALALSTVMLLLPREAGAQNAPTCADRSGACINQWGNHWFGELNAEISREHELEATRNYRLPSASRDFVTNGGKSIRLNSATMEFLVLPLDGGARLPWTSQDLRTGSSRNAILDYDNPGERGRVYSKTVVNLTFRDRDQGDITLDWTMLDDNGRQEYVNSNCEYGSPSTGYWRVTYLKSTETGGKARKHMTPGDTNSKRCAANDWAQEGAVYQAQVCRGSTCTRPDLVGGFLGSRDLRDRNFSREIQKLDEGNDDATWVYHIMDRDGNQTGHRSFTADLWEWIKDDYENDDTYYLFTKQSGHSPDLGHDRRGRHLDQLVSQ